MKQDHFSLKYSSEAPIIGELSTYAVQDGAWESHSLPLGNGFFGANVFGRTVTERIQISEPSLANPYYTPKTVPRKHCSAVGVNSFAELFFDLGHTEAEEYERSLSLDEAISFVSYRYNGVEYTREAFTSHPDKILAVRLKADKKGALSFKARALIPFIGEYTVEPGDGFAKSGAVTYVNDSAIIEGEMEYYGIKFLGIMRVTSCDGRVLAEKDGIKVENATVVTVFFSCDTNYQLTSEVFDRTEHQDKLRGMELDRAVVINTVEKAANMPYDELKKRHISDYRSLYSRVTLNIGGGKAGHTEKLLAEHRAGKVSTYLEALLFQFGRYLLISSSRTRLPAHLQGIWNAYCDSPWSCGYWHNINVQMNYWPSGPANLSETFIPYINYAKAYMASARGHADKYIREIYPESYTENGTNGWIIGTGAWAYGISGFSGGGHSGPGTGAFTSLLFWDYYDFTHDTEFLREFGYPALYEMSVFLSKALVETDGKFLIKESASPENRHEGKHYQTEGCAFDQQMVYENFKRTIESAEILGIRDPFVDKIKGMLPHLDPVLIGDDGQVKEYREETTYSSIGEPHHRHISHLVGLYPATVINSETPEWLEGARVTLDNRGDRSTCWAVAHRLLLRARTKAPKKCRDLINSFIEDNVKPNLWCYHPPFQIDGNFGYTAGVCEMLMQSQSGYIELLPSIPPEWDEGEFTGLVARGNMTVDCAWEKGEAKTVTVTARADGELKIKLPDQLIPSGAETENGIYRRYMKKGESIVFGKFLVP